MKTILFIGILFFMSCDNAATETENSNESSTIDTTTVNEERSDVTVTTATYEDATVYAARTDYRFLTETGEELLIEGNTFEQEPIIEVPEGMVDDSEELDGLPGGHPNMIGKAFKIYYNEEGKAFKIELAE